MHTSKRYASERIFLIFDFVGVPTQTAIFTLVSGQGDTPRMCIPEYYSQRLHIQVGESCRPSVDASLSPGEHDLRASRSTTAPVQVFGSGRKGGISGGPCRRPATWSHSSSDEVSAEGSDEFCGAVSSRLGRTGSGRPESVESSGWQPGPGGRRSPLR